MTPTSCLRGCDLLLSYFIQSYVMPRTPFAFVLPSADVTVQRALPAIRWPDVRTTRGAIRMPDPSPTRVPFSSWRTRETLAA